VSRPPVPGEAGLRHFLAAHPLWSALAGGLLLASALPPVFFLPGLVGLALLLHLSRHAASGRQALLCGWLFGVGFFLAGLYWVGIAFFADAERFGIFAVPAVALLVGTLAIGPAVIALLGYWTRGLSPPLHAALFALLWAASELLRGDWGVRFPWNPIAVVWAASDATLQPVAWIGTTGLGLLTVFAAALLVLWLEDGEQRRIPALALLGFPLLLLAAGSWRLAGDAPVPAEPKRVRVVQANIAQHHKWNPDKQLAWFRRHLALSRQGWPDPLPDLVVWPESAVPYAVDRPEVREALASAIPEGAYLVFGADRYAKIDGRPDLTNSLYLLDSRGEVLDRYDKVDLVPFGEFLPFRTVLSRIGFKKLTTGTIDFRAGPGRRTLAAPGIPPFSPLICYEAAFPGRATDGSDHARLLINITNDAWFGRSSGPYQHFAMARMRAAETGLPLVRAANTGISAVVDGFGRVRASLPLMTTGVIDTTLPPAIAPPPIARFPALAWMSVLIVGFVSLLVDLFARSATTSRRTGQPAADRRRPG